MCSFPLPRPCSGSPTSSRPGGRSCPLAVALGSFFVLAVAVHSHLALDRPAPEHLTRFYLVQSAGGLLATTFVALVAPLAFPTVLEYPLLIVGALLAIASCRPCPGRTPHRGRCSRCFAGSRRSSP